MVSGGVYSSFPASGATSMTVEETIPEQEVVMLAGDEIYDAEDIPVSYHNALILNEVQIKPNRFFYHLQM